MIKYPWLECVSAVDVVVVTDGHREQNFTHCLKTDRRKQMERERKGLIGMERCFKEESVEFLFFKQLHKLWKSFRSLFSLDFTFSEENVSGAGIFKNHRHDARPG